MGKDTITFTEGQHVSAQLICEKIHDDGRIEFTLAAATDQAGMVKITNFTLGKGRAADLASQLLGPSAPKLMMTRLAKGQRVLIPMVCTKEEDEVGARLMVNGAEGTEVWVSHNDLLLARAATFEVIREMSRIKQASPQWQPARGQAVLVRAYIDAQTSNRDGETQYTLLFKQARKGVLLSHYVMRSGVVGPDPFEDGPGGEPALPFLPGDDVFVKSRLETGRVVSTDFDSTGERYWAVRTSNEILIAYKADELMSLADLRAMIGGLAQGGSGDE